MPSTPLKTRALQIPARVIAKADVLLEALPYLQAFRGKTVVVKFGGSALTDPLKRRTILQDIVFLSVTGIRPVLVHGGGPEFSRQLSKRGKRLINKTRSEAL